jgi:predicted nucleic acid-binding Zn ribbon protein
MPKYVYKCLKCENTFDVTHSFSEQKEDCSQIAECKESSKIERVPQHINYVKKQEEKKAQVGQIVDDFIKDAKKEVKEYKDEMINWKPE